MPDFDLRLASGVTIVEWSDSRANPLPSRPSRQYRGTVGTEIEARAIFGGTEAPPDTAVGGLWSSDIGEYPSGRPPPPTSHVGGYTSIQRFTPPVPGHYLWVIRREGGGAFAIHIEVVSGG